MKKKSVNFGPQAGGGKEGEANNNTWWEKNISYIFKICQIAATYLFNITQAPQEWKRSACRGVEDPEHNESTYYRQGSTDWRAGRKCFDGCPTNGKML